MNIVQFVPYYEPHIGGVEKVASDIHKNWNYGASIVFTSDIGQKKDLGDEKIIMFPAFNLVSNFPFPKFWQKDFWTALKSLKKYYGDDTRIITHTRFFLSSFLGAYIAKKSNIKHIHIEHGSGFVKSGNTITDILSKIYDKTFSKYCIQNADTVLAISNASADFVKKEFGKYDTKTWYRGIDFLISNKEKKIGKIIFVYIGRLVALKQVDNLIEAYQNGGFSERCIIIGNGEERSKLEKLSQGMNIRFLGQKSHNEIIEFLQENRCILVNPSEQEGLPTTVIEGLMTKNIVIATDVGGTSEISSKGDLQLYKSGDIDELTQAMRESLSNYDNGFGKSYNDVKEKFSMDKSIEELYNHMQ